MQPLTPSTKKRSTPSTNARQRRLSVSALILLPVFVSFTASLATAEQRITPVAEGTPAPFAGDLYPVSLSVDLALKLETCQERAKLTLEHSVERYRIRLSQCESTAQVKLYAAQRRLAILDDELSKQDIWYESTIFVIVVTTVSTVAILLGSAYLLDVTLGRRQ